MAGVAWLQPPLARVGCLRGLQRLPAREVRSIGVFWGADWALPRDPSYSTVLSWEVRPIPKPVAKSDWPGVPSTTTPAGGGWRLQGRRGPTWCSRVPLGFLRYEGAFMTASCLQLPCPAQLLRNRVVSGDGRTRLPRWASTGTLIHSIILETTKGRQKRSLEHSTVQEHSFSRLESTFVCFSRILSSKAVWGCSVGGKKIKGEQVNAKDTWQFLPSRTF